MAPVGAGLGVPRDGVVGLGAEASGHLPPVTDLDGLDRLDAHEGERQEGVELAVPVDVAAEPDRHAVPDDLDDAAHAVALLGRGLDGRHHLVAGLRVEAPHGRGVDGLEIVGSGAGAGGGGDAAHRHDVGHDLDADAPQQQLGQSAGGHPGGGLARRRPLERVAGVVVPVLLHGGQVGVAGPRGGEALARLAGSRGHLLLPLRPLGVRHLDQHRTAQRAAVPDAADEVQLVALEPLARPAAVAEAPAGELGGDVVDRDGQTRGQALDDHAEGLAVRLARGQVAQHGRGARGPPGRRVCTAAEGTGRPRRPVNPRRCGGTRPPGGAGHATGHRRDGRVAGRSPQERPARPSVSRPFRCASRGCRPPARPHTSPRRRGRPAGRRRRRGRRRTAPARPRPRRSAG